MKIQTLLLIAFLILTIDGCARRTFRNTQHIPPREGQPRIYDIPDSGTEEGVSGQPSQLPESTTPPPLQSSPAVIALIEQSDYEWREGNVSQAVVVIERAIRIQPRNPVLWYRLASLRLQQGRYELAENMARKSSSLARSNKTLIQKNREIIRKAQRKQK
ncbi:MAG: tetratricopeptide repeat protein [Methylococcales bacterium]